MQTSNWRERLAKETENEDCEGAVTWVVNVENLINSFKGLQKESIEQAIEVAKNTKIDKDNEHTPYWQLGAARMRKTIVDSLKTLYTRYEEDNPTPLR